jgi:hypothetical protein
MGPLWAGSIPPPRAIELSLSSRPPHSPLLAHRRRRRLTDPYDYPPLQSSSRLGSLNHVFFTYKYTHQGAGPCSAVRLA